MFVIVVRLDKIKDSEEQLWYWLRFIKNRMSEQPSADEKPTVILVGSSRDAVHDRTIVREEKEGWISDWGNDRLKEVCERISFFNKSPSHCDILIVVSFRSVRVTFKIGSWSTNSSL